MERILWVPVSSQWSSKESHCIPVFMSLSHPFHNLIFSIPKQLTRVVKMEPITWIFCTNDIEQILVLIHFFLDKTGLRFIYRDSLYLCGSFFSHGEYVWLVKKIQGEMVSGSHLPRLLCIPFLSVLGDLLVSYFPENTQKGCQIFQIFLKYC